MPWRYCGVARHSQLTVPLAGRRPLGRFEWRALRVRCGCARIIRCGALPVRALAGHDVTVLDDLYWVQVVVLASSGHGSQASPTPSLSASPCMPLSTGRIGLNTDGQLSA